MSEIILYGLLNLLGLILLAIWGLNQLRAFLNAQPKSSFFTWKRFRFPTIVALLLVIPWWIVQHFTTDLNFRLPEDEIKFAEVHGRYLDVSNSYHTLLSQYPDSLELHFQYVDFYRQYIYRLLNRQHAYIDDPNIQEDEAGKDIEKYYRSIRQAAPDLHHLMLAMHHINLHRTDTALKHIQQVRSTNGKYYHFVRGKIRYQQAQYEKADSLLHKEIDLGGHVPGAYGTLAAMYYRQGADAALEALVNDASIAPHVDDYFKKYVYFKQLDLWNYFKVVLLKKVEQANPIGTSAALLIMGVWLMYIRKLDIYEPERWRDIIATLVMSCITIWFVYPLSDILNYGFGFELNNNPINDFFYCWIGIGMVEELVKIVPVLIMLRFTKAINEPYDYILYASVSALGFAFVENIGYLELSAINNISGRALMAAVAHMMFSSIIGYGMMLARYKYKRGKLRVFVLFFLLAALAHGWYDFWLINDWASEYAILTIGFFMITIHLWFIMKNNAINISNFFDKKIKLENDKLAMYLIVSLLSILMGGFVAIAFDSGRSEAQTYLVGQTVVFGYLIFYLVGSFSRYDIVRGYMAPFSIPFSFLVPKKQQTQDHSGLEVALYRSQQADLAVKFPLLAEQFPVKGKVVRRKVLSGDKHWWAVQLEESLFVEGLQSDHVLIRAKTIIKDIHFDGNVLVQVTLLSDQSLLDKQFLTKEEVLFLGWALSKRKLI